MKNSKVTENRDAQHFQRLLADRLDALERQREGGDTSFHTGTERLLIHFAFDRISKDEYWFCVKCEEDIAEERLLTDPTTLTCAECAAPPGKR